MDARLLEILVCPLCKGPLKRLPGGRSADGRPFDAELVCNADRLAYPVRDGIPVMLESEARRLEPEAGDTVPRELPDPGAGES
ncbi:MAG: Trm112 family protein [Burkholderiaceae bacterium]|nr:Trm112 family protein [Burkholderiaceae bacterium]